MMWIWVAIGAALAVEVVVARRWRNENWEDLWWMLGHLLLIPTVFVALGAPWDVDARPSAWKLCVGFVLFDALAYVVHRAMHEHRVTWGAHRQHHSIEQMGTLSVWRASAVQRIALGLAAWVPAWLLAASPMTVLVWVVVAALVQLVAHADRVDGAWLERLGIVSPRFHRAHHYVGSRWNYGHSLTVWDRLLGTYVLPPETEPALGLRDMTPDEISDLRREAAAQGNPLWGVSLRDSRGETSSQARQ